MYSLEDKTDVKLFGLRIKIVFFIVYLCFYFLTKLLVSFGRYVGTSSGKMRSVRLAM